MDEILKKLRTKFTLTTMAIAAIFVLILFGGFFGLLCASDATTEKTHIQKVLEDPSLHGAPFDMQCVIIKLYDDGGYDVTQNADYYQELAPQILRTAVNKGGGTFRVGEYHFLVGSEQKSGYTLYVVMDRTSAANSLLSTALILVALYILSIALVALLAYLFSAKTLEPVKQSLEKQRDLIANASHELKTPLTIIGTNVSVIKSEPASTVEENAKWISSIDAQVTRMNDLIQSMLELSKLEQSVVPREEFDFSAAAEGACLAFEAVCFEKQVQLLSDIQPDITVFGDKNALERLIIILLDNAIKYSGQNGKIGCKLDVDTKKAHLTVLNTGQSISDEEAKHVFDRFYRSDGARSNNDNKSFGLGLSIAQATVLMHGGTIFCRGVEGKGTVFEVKLPLVKKTLLQDTKKHKKSDNDLDNAFFTANTTSGEADDPES